MCSAPTYSPLRAPAGGQDENTARTVGEPLEHRHSPRCTLGGERLADNSTLRDQEHLGCRSHGCAIRGDFTASERIPPVEEPIPPRTGEQRGVEKQTGQVGQVSDHRHLLRAGSTTQQSVSETGTRTRLLRECQPSFRTCRVNRTSCGRCYRIPETRQSTHQTLGGHRTPPGDSPSTSQAIRRPGHRRRFPPPTPCPRGRTTQNRTGAAPKQRLLRSPPCMRSAPTFEGLSVANREDQQPR